MGVLSTMISGGLVSLMLMSTGARATLKRQDPIALRRSASQQSATAGVSTGLKSDYMLQKALAALWEGVDFRNESYSFQFLAPESHQQELEDKKHVQIFGLPHTGTNLLNAMLWVNFGDKLNHLELNSGGPPVNGTSKAPPALWRYANIKETWAADRDKVTKFENMSVNAVIMIREPFSWLHMVRKTPYEFKSCVEGEDWLMRTCTHSSPGGYRSKAPARVYPSMTGVWNQWYDGYTKASGFGFPKARVIKYEDLVGNPDGVMDTLAKMFGLEKPEQGWKGLSGSSEGENIGRLTAFENIHSMNYLEEFSIPEQRKVCSTMDKTLAANFGYKACESIMTAHPAAPAESEDSVPPSAPVARAEPDEEQVH